MQAARTRRIGTAKEPLNDRTQNRCRMTRIGAFANREEAGRVLADQLAQFRGRTDVIVLALPRGGVPVGYQIARQLQVPLDAIVVRKLGVPYQPELAMGAIASGGIRVLNGDIVRQMHLDDATIQAETRREREEMERRERAYRNDRPFPHLDARTVILVDDGLATGATMRAALQAVRQLGASRVIVAVPVAPPETARAFEREADEFYCLAEPKPFGAIGYWYSDFSQVDDETVRLLLERSSQVGSQADATTRSRQL